jgi:hypothetical protein
LTRVIGFPKVEPCRGVLRLFRDIERSRAEAVSARAIEIGGLNCKSIASLIANHKAARHSTEPTAIVDHANLRGREGCQAAS